MGIGLGLPCCGGCEAPLLPDLEIDCALQNTFLRVTANSDVASACVDAEYVNGDYVADYAGEGELGHLFVRKLGEFRDDTVEVEIEVDVESGAVLRVLVMDETYASQFVINEAGDKMVFESVEEHQDCCGTFNVSVFYAARRFEAGVHPTSMTYTFASETNGTLAQCTDVNNMRTLPFLSVADLLDGFNYTATWLLTTPAVCVVTFSRSTSAAAQLGGLSLCVFVGNDGVNRFRSILSQINCGNVDRDVDVAVEVDDWGTLTNNIGVLGCSAVSFATCAIRCGCDAELTEFAEIP